MNGESAPRLDSVDAAIVRELRAGGRMPFETLAGRVGWGAASAWRPRVAPTPPGRRGRSHRSPGAFPAPRGLVGALSMRMRQMARKRIGQSDPWRP
ncbi:AsnC family protein [Streptomonospora alba]|uniref:AsnC family protein n=1 Tax=Streptomonospora alba TaxID=183763 RepID=UPI000A023D06|nr:AsnC family protein [Streptomonospora alba]